MTASESETTGATVIDRDDEVGDTEDDRDVDVDIDAAEPARAPVTYQVRRWVCWAAAAAVVLSVVGAAVLGWMVFQQHQRDTHVAQALDAARRYAVILTTTDQNAIDKNFTDVTAEATGDFKDAYTKAWSRMRKMLIDNKVATTGTVIDAAATRSQGDDVDVLMSVKQVITSAESPKPRTDIVIMSVVMRKVGDKWLAAQVSLTGPDGQRAR